MKSLFHRAVWELIPVGLVLIGIYDTAVLTFKYPAWSLGFNHPTLLALAILFYFFSGIFIEYYLRKRRELIFPGWTYIYDMEVGDEVGLDEGELQEFLKHRGIKRIVTFPENEDIKRMWV